MRFDLRSADVSILLPGRGLERTGRERREVAVDEPRRFFSPHSRAAHYELFKVALIVPFRLQTAPP